MIFHLKSSFIASITLFFSSLLMFSFATYLNHISMTWPISWEICSINSSIINFPIIFDPMGTLFASTVLLISANVMLFASTYMAEEIFLTRFIILVLLFVLSMNMLIFFPHLMTLLLGWDGLGLTSFILVIYYQNAKSLGAGMITALTNRIGDVTLLVAIGWTLNNNHWSIMNMWFNPMSNLIILCITIAAMTKSAQMPFSSWLPAAMAAPTPVSALVHSSTLVTAGVFLIIRFYDFLSSFYLFTPILLLTASFTMFMAGLSAMTECDLKKIIALSTLSQLGVMMASLALGYPKLAFFHLITHALFKALLFICAGSIIHFHQHGQDLRTIGNLTNQLPFTMSCMLIANMSLCAAPFLSGFYSKDLILELSLFNPLNYTISLMFFCATTFTAAYSVRMTLTAIWSNNLASPNHFLSNHDMNMVLPITSLTLGAILAGASINWWISPMNLEPILPMHLKFLPISAMLLGIFFAWQTIVSFSTNLSFWQNNKMSHNASCLMWFMTPISTQSLISTPYLLALHFQKTLDNGWTEMSSAEGTFFSSFSISNLFIPIQKNQINSFALLILILMPIIYFVNNS
uniref:NADH-ubiquinone oxidoreductase chain 5 n=1 Tax=Pista cristata TaxID=279652 RepID=B3TK00_9ANNE|nr:NADH dehydrogenase subunit 5 [Pista cristata]